MRVTVTGEADSIGGKLCRPLSSHTGVQLDASSEVLHAAFEWIRRHRRMTG